MSSPDSHSQRLAVVGMKNAVVRQAKLGCGVTQRDEVRAVGEPWESRGRNGRLCFDRRFTPNRFCHRDAVG